MLAAYAPLPFAFAHLGWPAGIIFLGLAGLVTWYTSLLLASLDRHDGHRHVRYCDLAGSIYGAHLPYGSTCHLQSKWKFIVESASAEGCECILFSAWSC